MSDTVSGLAFLVLSLAAVGGALAMVTTRNVLHAGFWLFEVSGVAACIYLLLGADYVALVQLLVYAGAVAVLVIFSIMITLRRRQDAIRPRDFSALAALMAAVFCIAMTLAVKGMDFSAAVMPKAMPDLVTFGSSLFSVKGWALPFEIASVVLTAALVGAVYWSKDGDE